jgi:6-phosphofructokinase 1
MEKIGVLTGGGDCPGLNPAIRAVVMKAKEYDYEIIGIKDGWKGLLTLDTMPLNISDVQEIISFGGTIIGTSRKNPLKKEEDKKKVLENIKKLELSALIAIGGDDTLSVAAKLSDEGIPIIGIPKTMDNDLLYTDYTFGFDTAVTVAVECLERLRDTAKSHRRVMVFEVMGRYAGWVALFTGIAGGADWILLPEVPFDIDEMCNHLKYLREKGRNYALVVASEGIQLPEIEERDKDVDEFGHVILKERGVGERVAKIIEEKTGWETRYAVVGHIQRGGSPTIFDRILATRLGVKAVELIKEKKFGKMVCLRGNEIEAVDLSLATSKTKFVPKEWIELAKTFYK